MRVAHTYVVHVLDGVADVVDAVAALTDALRHHPRAPVQVELAHKAGMGRVGEKRERADTPAAARVHRYQPRFIDAAGHLPIPQTLEHVLHPRRFDAERHAPARAAAAKTHHQAWAAMRAAIPCRENAKRPMEAVHAPNALLLVGEAGRPDERAVAEHPQVTTRQPVAEFLKLHVAGRL